LEYQLGVDWQLKSNFGYSHSTIEETRTSPNTQFNPAVGSTSSSSALVLNQGNRSSWIVEPQLSWKKELGKHSFNIMIGTTFQKDTNKQLVIFGRGFSSNSLIYNIAAANNIIIPDANKTEYNYQAFFA